VTERCQRRIIGSEVRRIADNKVETCTRHGGRPVAQREFYIRKEMATRVFAGDGQRSGTLVGCGNKAGRPLFGEGHGNGAAAGAEVQDTRCLARLQMP
jgi:hypothetical protein